MESRMAIQVIDNFLEKDEFNKLSDNIMGDSFPWYYNDGITNSDDKNNFYLTHIFYRQPGIKSNWFNMWLSTIEKLKCKSIIRIKANRAVLFNPSVLHSSSLCDDKKRRITINFNYF